MDRGEVEGGRIEEDAERILEESEQREGDETPEKKGNYTNITTILQLCAVNSKA